MRELENPAVKPLQLRVTGSSLLWIAARPAVSRPHDIAIREKEKH
jgi:hypothetical protein